MNLWTTGNETIAMIEGQNFVFGPPPWDFASHCDDPDIRRKAAEKVYNRVTKAKRFGGCWG